MCEQSNKMEEHVHRTQIPLLLISKQGHNSRTEKVVKFEIKLGLPFMFPDLVQSWTLLKLDAPLPPTPNA
jgi:hypothetical protein